jgi:tetratricopeptide (TPR) repeat protein
MSDPEQPARSQQLGDTVHGDKAEGDVVHGDKIEINAVGATVEAIAAAVAQLRRERSTEAAPPPTARRALSLQALIAAPLIHRAQRGQHVDLQPVTALEVIAELDAIRDACEIVDPPVALDIGVTIATAEALGRMLATRTSAADILHFSGHGALGDEGVALVLENELGAARLMRGDELRTLLAPLTQPPCRLAMVSACHSQGIAEELLRANVAHVVAINADDPVLDLAARRFAQRFYPALLAGRSVAEAFEHAQAAVLSDDTLHELLDPQTLQPVAVREALKFRLLPEGDARHQQSLVEGAAEGAVRFVRPPWERTNLPATSPDPFVGRRRELYKLAELLAHSSCVAVHGWGGMGKTALALAAGRWQHERNRHPDGVWVVELRNVDTTSQARVQIASILSLDPKVAGSDKELAAALRDTRALLILDDLDVLLENDRQALVALLRELLSCRRLRLLLTSRRDLPGQVAHQRLVLTRLEDEDALRAFRSYAPPIESWGQWTPAHLQAVLDFLDGYPFPIRLAGHYMGARRCDLATLRARLAANPRGTMQYPGDPTDRETSLAATLDLSYHALPVEAQAVLPHLALFPAGLSRPAIQAILGPEAEEALETLLQHGMAEYRDEAGYQRFALPEPARSYAEGLQPAGLLDQLAPAALAFYSQVVDAGNDQIVAGKVLEGRLLITLEQPNLRRFLAWGYDHEQRDDERSLSARTTALLGNYWTATNTTNQPEVAADLQRALGAARRNSDRFGEANTLRAIGDVQQFRDDRDAALESYQQALALYRAVGAKLGEANTRKAIGDVQQFHKDPAALESYQQALALYRAVGAKLGEANTLRAIGDVQQFHKDPAALESYQQALALYRAVGDRLGEANTLRAIGDVQQFRDDRDAALESYQQALALYRAVGDRLGEANTLAAQSRLLIDSDSSQSQELLDQALALREATGDVYSTGADLGNYAIALLRRGRNQEAIGYFQRARELFAARGLQAQVAQTDAFIAQAEGAPSPTQQILAALPEAVRLAIEAGDGQVLQAALQALPEAEAARIIQQLQQAGILAAPRGPDMAEVLRNFEPLLQAIAAIARGDETERTEVEATLADLETKGWRLSAPVQQIWQNERDLDVLTEGLDAQDSALIRRLLEMLASDG